MLSKNYSFEIRLKGEKPYLGPQSSIPWSVDLLLFVLG